MSLVEKGLKVSVPNQLVPGDNSMIRKELTTESKGSDRKVTRGCPVDRQDPPNFFLTCISAMNKKKALAARLICSYRKRGRNVNTPYLAVL